MGTAVLSAILNSTFDPYPAKFICCTGSEASASKLQSQFGDKIETSFGKDQNVEAVKNSNIIILGCKPYMCEDIMGQVAEGLHDQLIISLLAGWSIAQLEKYSKYIARVMTNTPAQYGYGMAVISLSEPAEKYDDLILKLINPVGKAIKVPEKNMVGASSIVGSGPAFYLLMLESVIEGGVRMGLPYPVARECAIKTMEGSAKMAEITGEHPAVLKNAVCTPGGMTIGGLMEMEDRGIRSAISRGVEEAAKIGSSLGKK